jgi:hypothetical protein
VVGGRVSQGSVGCRGKVRTRGIRVRLWVMWTGCGASCSHCRRRDGRGRVVSRVKGNSLGSSRARMGNAAKVVSSRVRANSRGKVGNRDSKVSRDSKVRVGNAVRVVSNRGRVSSKGKVASKVVDNREVSRAAGNVVGSSRLVVVASVGGNRGRVILVAGRSWVGIWRMDGCGAVAGTRMPT